MIHELPQPDITTMTRAAPEGWHDEPTGLPGPAFWAVVLGTESARCARYKRPATVLLARVTGFDEIVRSWSREVALRAVADIGAILRSGCRLSDYVVRLGDDRFGMILTETDEIAAINMVERVRDRCDRVLRARFDDSRVAFGWASASMAIRLADCVAIAEERQLREAEADRPDPS